MKPLAGFDGAKDVEGLFFDLDDTVLTHGLLTREAYGAIWDLHEAGMKLVAVTGRPSGWAEILVRQWPIDGAVAENGAVFVTREGAGIRIALDGAEDRRPKLAALVAFIGKEMPAIELADDVHARRTDVTWDIGERCRVAEAEVARLQSLIVGAGARTTRSTVHVHGSFERDDKASGAVRFAHVHFGHDPGCTLGRWAFVGDSVNDAACFSAFRNTFGVANVRRFASRLSVPPRWITSQERGAGFAELARTLLAGR